MEVPALPPAPGEIPDQWDTYLCHVDDAPASFLVNLWFRDQAPLDGVDTVYYWSCPMTSPAEDGLGDEDEAARFDPIQDSISGFLEAHGFYPVGRLRNQGAWQLTYYGHPGQEVPFREAVSRGLAGGPYDRFDAGWRHDPSWSYYHDFLHPSPRQRRWMADLKLVEALSAGGDPLTMARRVDHFAHFAEPGGRDAFVAEASGAGFQLMETEDRVAGPYGFACRVAREDPVVLEHISGVSWHLTELAGRCGGEYDGWETNLLRPGN